MKTKILLCVESEKIGLILSTISFTRKEAIEKFVTEMNKNSKREYKWTHFQRKGCFVRKVELKILDQQITK